MSERALSSSVEVNEQPRRFAHFESYSKDKSELIRLLSHLKDVTSVEFRRLKDRIHRMTVLSMVGIATLQAPRSEAPKISVPYEVMADVGIDNADQYFSNRARNDKSEAGFVFDYAGKVRQFLGNANNINFDFDDVRRETAGANKIVLGHTHPLEAYVAVGYDENQIKQMQTGDAAPMPPSFDDIGFIISAHKKLSDSGKPIDGQVADATGVWHFSIDGSNSAVVAYQRGLEAIQKFLDGMLIKRPDVAKRISELKEKGIHPGYIVGELEKDESLKEFLDACEEGARSIQDQDEEYRNVSEGVERLGSFCVQIAQSNFNVDKQLPGYEEELIEDYIAAAAEIGVTVTYTPNVI